MATGKKKTRKTFANKSERFTETAKVRVSRALQTIANVGKLGSKAYESTTDQRKKIKTALNSAVETALAQLEGTSASGFDFE